MSQRFPPGVNFGRENVRRGPGPIVPPQVAHQPSPAQIREQQRHEHAAHEKAMRSSRKPTDRHIPDELATVIVGDGVRRYEQLRDAERRLDALMMRKRLDVKDNASRTQSRREGTLRIWISNTAEGQPWQVAEEGSGLNADGTFDFENDSSLATYRVKIEGRLLEDASPEPGQEEATPAPKFSSFFSSISVKYHRDPALEPDGFSQIAWQRQQATAQNPVVDLTSKHNSFDTMEFERKGDENINVTINLVRDHKREVFRLWPALAELLDTEEDDLSGVVHGIWEYARAMNLQEDDDKRTITCDDALAKAFFNRPTLQFSYLPDMITSQAQPLPPVQLKYTIRVDKAYISPSDSSTASQPTVYDIRVPLPNTLTPVLAEHYNSKSHVDTLKGIISMDNDIALLVAKINQTNAKRKFFENLSKDPAGFVQRWMGSQKRDLEVIMAEATRGGGEDGEQWSKGGQDGVWGTDIARESVGLWLARSGRS